MSEYLLIISLLGGLDSNSFARREASQAVLSNLPMATSYLEKIEQDLLWKRVIFRPEFHGRVLTILRSRGDSNVGRLAIFIPEDHYLLAAMKNFDDPTLITETPELLLCEIATNLYYMDLSRIGFRNQTIERHFRERRKLQIHGD